MVVSTTSCPSPGSGGIGGPAEATSIAIYYKSNFGESTTALARDKGNRSNALAHNKGNAVYSHTLIYRGEGDLGIHPTPETVNLPWTTSASQKEASTIYLICLTTVVRRKKTLRCRRAQSFHRPNSTHNSNRCPNDMRN